MSQDIKFFNACDHYIDEIHYDLNLCPRCYGKGYYLDIHFDNNGEPALSTGSIKLQQEMLKVIIDEKYKNEFHPLWGTETTSLIGSKNIEINKMKLEVIIRNALDYLKNVQLGQNQQYKNMNKSEILDKILHVNIIPLKPTGYHVEITVSNIADEVITQSINL